MTTRELYDEGISQSEREHCFRLHQLQARMERELRPHEHDVPDVEPILDVSPHFSVISHSVLSGNYGFRL